MVILSDCAASIKLDRPLAQVTLSRIKKALSNHVLELTRLVKNFIYLEQQGLINNHSNT